MPFNSSLNGFSPSEEIFSKKKKKKSLEEEKGIIVLILLPPVILRLFFGGWNGVLSPQSSPKSLGAVELLEAVRAAAHEAASLHQTSSPLPTETCSQSRG